MSRELHFFSLLLFISPVNDGPHTQGSSLPMQTSPPLIVDPDAVLSGQQLGHRRLERRHIEHSIGSTIIHPAPGFPEPQRRPWASDASAQTAEALAQREAEIQKLKDRVNKNASEVETLRKELQSVQKQIGGQNARQDSQNRKTVPPSKSQQTAP